MYRVAYLMMRGEVCFSVSDPSLPFRDEQNLNRFATKALVCHAAVFCAARGACLFIFPLCPLRALRM